MDSADRRPPAAASFHLFTIGERSFLFDPLTRTSFDLDPAGEVAARARLLGTDGAAVRTGAPRLDEAEVKAASDELAQLQARGYFAEDAGWPSLPQAPSKHAVAVTLSRRCNLRCRYCFTHNAARRGPAALSAPLDMSPSVMEATATFIGGLWGSSRLDWPVIGVACAGEVACQLELCDRFEALLKAESQHAGVEFPLSAWSGTNLTRLSDPAVLDRLLELRCGGVSLDGPPEAHDAMRMHPDGRGTYADARRGLDLLRARGYGGGRVGASLTGAYPDVLSVYQHLFELRFDAIAVKPVRSRPDQPYSIAKNLDRICEAYCRFAEWILSLPDGELREFLRRIMHVSGSSDYFGRFLERVLRRHLVQHRCPGGLYALEVDTDGQIYVCPGLTGVAEARLGSVREGLDDARVQELAREQHVSRRIPCRDCWARLVCGGGCMHQSYLTYGSLGPIDPSECLLNQHLIELAIWVCSALRRERPQVLALISA
jgi:uncharacterized protein